MKGKKKNLLSLMIAIVVTFSFTVGAFAQSANDTASQNVTDEKTILAVSENPDETPGGEQDNLNDNENVDNGEETGGEKLPEQPDVPDPSDGEEFGDAGSEIEGGEKTPLHDANFTAGVDDDAWDIAQYFPTTLSSSSNENWRYVVGSGVGSDYKITDNSTYVNIAKTKGAEKNCHVWIASPGNPLPALPEAGGFTVETRVKVNEIANAQSPIGNKIGVRFHNTQLMEIYIGYGEAGKGFVSLKQDGNSPFTYFLDTTDWVDYRIVVHDANTFSVYANETLAIKNAPKGTDIGTSGSNIVKFGAESPYVCDMDVASVKIAYSDLVPDSATAEPLEIINPDSFCCEAGVGGSLPLKATGTGPIEYSLEGAVPDGVAIEQNASTYPGVGAALKVAGTVIVGTYPITIKADNGVDLAEQTFILTVTPGSESGEGWTSTQAFYPAWNANSWASSTGTNAGSVSSLIKQESDYVNLTKNKASSTACYSWIVSPAAITFPSGAFTIETRARVNDFEAAGPIGNKLSIRANKNASAGAKDRLFEIYISYGQNDGYVSATPDGSGDYTYWLDTAVFHDYRIVVNEAHDKFSLYVDGDLAFENAPYAQITDSNSKGRDLFKAGAESTQVCNMDLESVNYADSALIPSPVSGVRKVELNKDSYFNNEQNTLDVTVTTVLTDNDTPYTLTLVDNARQPLASSITATGTITDNTGSTQLAIPKAFPIGRYYVRADVEGKYRYSSGFNVVEPLGTPPVFPTMKPVGYTIEMEDYQKNPTEEFQFPTVIDASLHLNNPIARYYLFYAPHEQPGGIYLATSDSLYGPWKEYGDGPLVARTWPNDAGGDYYSVSHVSAQDVVWNDVYNCYFMYYHGENTTTRYATSDDLINWTYGDVCFVAKDFDTNGTEASYGRVFEHEIPGLGNKYIMLLMINNTGNMRKIYYAHSQDGINWTPVKTPLLTPDNSKAPEGTTYSGTPGISMTGANLSGPFFHVIDGRYYVTTHASSGDVFIFEVGESFNKEIHWGRVYNSVDNSGSDVEDGWPDYGRAGAAYFIHDDEGVMHMFYEGGRRLHANIIHAVETCTITASAGAHGSISPSGNTTVFKGTSPTPPSFSITPDQGYEIDKVTVNGQQVSASNPYTFAKVMEDSEFYVTFKPQSSASGNNGNSSDSDNSTDSSANKPTAPSLSWLEPNSAQGLSANEQNHQNLFLRTSSSGKYGVRKSSFAAFGGLRFEHDTVVNNAVQVRLYINQPENITKDTFVSGYVSGTEVERTQKMYEKWFANQLGIIHFDQQEDWGITVSVAAKIDLSDADTQNLCFYSYNRATNSYQRIAAPAYWIDENGYLRFTTPYAGDIIISERPLERR